MSGKYLRPLQQAPGFTPIITPGEMIFTEFGILRLAPGEHFTQQRDGVETGLVLLSGDCLITAPGVNCAATRRDVFQDNPTTVYLPSGMGWTITARTATEVAVSTALSNRPGKPQVIAPQDVAVKTLGQPTWQRDARFMLTTDVDAEHLFIGEAIVSGGNWASYPPHRHDFDNLPAEIDMEEVYFFKLDRPQGFGIQKVYTDDGSTDETYTVRDNDTVFIPEGYHPVTVAPGYTLYYLWVMAGNNRGFISQLDPNHQWIAKG